MTNVVPRARAAVTGSISSAVIVLFSLAASIAPASAATSAPPRGLQAQFLGDPVHVTHISAAYIGQHHVYEVVNGSPPAIVQYNPDGSVASYVSLPTGYNAWSIIESNGTIYTAVADGTSDKLGYIYSWVPGSAKVQLVAKIPNTVTVWQLAIDPVTGLMWVGAQGLYSVDLSTGTVQSYGTPGDPEVQVHGVAAYNGTVYFGTYPHANLISFNPATGATQTVATNRSSGVNWLSMSPDGQYVTVQWASGSLVTLKNGAPYGNMSGFDSPPQFVNGQTYLFNPIELVQGMFTPYNQTVTSYQFPSSANQAQTVLTDGVLNGNLAVLLDTNQLVTVNPTSLNTVNWSCSPQFSANVCKTSDASNPMTVASMSVQENPPAIIESLFADASGEWASVYLGGEVTNITGKTFTPHPLGCQVNGFASFQGTLYMGCYPGAYVLGYNESKSWNDPSAWTQFSIQLEVQKSTANNPIPPQQDRVFALAAGPRGVYAGTIPIPGVLDGNLGYYDPATQKSQVFDSPVPNEGITSLVYAPNGMLVGTTTAIGGGNVTSVQQSGYLFVWNPTTQKLVQPPIAPIPGQKEWGGLVVGPGGLIYGANPEAVFSFNPTTGHVVATRVINPRGGMDEWSGDTHMLAWRADLFLLTNGEMYQINPKTLAATRLFYGASQAVVDGNYLSMAYNDGVQLWDLPMARLTPYWVSH